MKKVTFCNICGKQTNKTPGKRLCDTCYNRIYTKEYRKNLINYEKCLSYHRVKKYFAHNCIECGITVPCKCVTVHKKYCKKCYRLRRCEISRNFKMRYMATEENRKSWASQKREYLLKFPEIYLLQWARVRAKQKNLKYDLNISDIKIPSYCPILKIPLIVGGRNGNSPSLDRINNSEGYIKGNVAVISRRANSLKSDGTLEEFKKIVDFLKKYEHKSN